MEDFEQAYQALNAEQKAAVDHIDGPLLVIAGPGTGKTQLLSIRVANILQKTDTNPENILCLTFTETGAENMKNRLANLIGQEAYKIPIHTYHSFGSLILQDARPDLRQAIDELDKNLLISEIQNQLAPNDILRFSYQLPDIISTISDIKSANLTPDELELIANHNEKDIAHINGALEETLNSIPHRARFDAAAPIYQEIAKGLADFISEKPIIKDVEVIANEMLRRLEQILDDESAQEKPSASPLSNWRKKFCRKDSNDHWRFDNYVAIKKLRSIANIMRIYQEKLEKMGSFDFDDMILRAIQYLESDQEARLNTQEHYQYILLDEFQDTNDAQARLVELLAINPVNENKPNIMAVGDDDQAIYGFQGANKSNFYDFDRLYQPKHIFLNKNYRSSEAILDFAHNIIEQGEDRFCKSPQVNIDKVISAENPPEETHIAHQEFKTPAGQYSAVSQSIEQLINQGIKPQQIAVIAPRHQSLKNLVPFLKHLDIDIAYKLRDNILDTTEISQIIANMEFILALRDALAKNKLHLVDYLIPRLMSFPCWQFQPLEVVTTLEEMRRDELSFFAYAEKLEDKEDQPLNQRLRKFANFYIRLAQQADDFSAEYIINEIIKVQFANTDNYQLFTNLTTLRELAQAKNQQSKLSLEAFSQLLQNYQACGLQILNQSPYRDTENSVQLLTVHSAKGLEFDYVFLLDSDDKNWSNAKGNTNKLTLPHNLDFVRHTGDSADEKLRVLFVAITRARKELILTSSSSSFSGKANSRLYFLDEIEEEDDTGDILIRSRKIPAPFNILKNPNIEEITVDDLSNNWFDAYLPLEIDDPTILKEKVQRFKLTASKAKSFIDLDYSTMTDFIRTYIYGWPSEAPSAQIIYGNIVHTCMEQLQNDQDDKTILESFEQEALQADLEKEEKDKLLERGRTELTKFLENRGSELRNKNIKVLSEKSLHENIVMNGVELTGKIDRVEIDGTNKIITVVDFKTGKPKEKWNDSDFTCFGYKLQLYFYKFLLENSHEFRNYQVTTGRIEFIPQDDNDENIALVLAFTPAESEKFQKLFSAIYHHIKNLDFPDTSEFEKQSNPSRAFAEFLLSE